MKYNTQEILKEVLKDNRYYIENSIIFYIGPLGTKQENMHWLAHKAYETWKDQGRRCTDKNRRHYQWYGAKGVKRIWSSRECINWWINEFFSKKEWNIPAVSRFNDIGNYTLENVKLIEQSENKKEVVITDNVRMSARKTAKKYLIKYAGWNKKKVKLTNIKDNTDYYNFESTVEAGKFINKSTSTISEAARENRNTIYKGKKYKVQYI